MTLPFSDALSVKTNIALKQVELSVPDRVMNPSLEEVQVWLRL